MFNDILQTYIIPALFKLILAFIIWIVGRWLASRARNFVSTYLARTQLTESFIVLLSTLTYYTIWVITLVLVLSAIGVPTTALVTVLGVVVVILAIAFQASLANFAATIIFLLFRPFIVGDLIGTAGVMGFVQEIQMFNTVILDPDGKVHVLPNGKIQGAGIANYSKTGRLRLELPFQIAYESDIDQAKEILMGILTTNDQILPEPAPLAFVNQLGESGIDLSGPACVFP